MDSIMKTSKKRIRVPAGVGSFLLEHSSNKQNKKGGEGKQVRAMMERGSRWKEGRKEGRKDGILNGLGVVAGRKEGLVNDRSVK